MFTWKKYVCEVYRERSFSKAAQNLYISQPSLSARIKKVEEQIGVPLFDRSTSPLQLTEAGRIYIRAAEEIRVIEQRVENAINNLNTLQTGRLSIGASNLFAAYVLPPLISRFKQRYPKIDVQIVEGNTDQLEAMLSSGGLDFVIDNYHYDSTLYSKESYCTEHILLAVPRHFPINKELEMFQLSFEDIRGEGASDADTPDVPLAYFSSLPFIMLTPGNDTRIRGERLCHEAGFSPDIILELQQQATAYMAASTQLGAAFISDMLVRRLPSFENLVYYKLAGDQALRRVFFYYKRHKYKTRAMEEFISLMHTSGDTVSPPDDTTAPLRSQEIQH